MYQLLLLKKIIDGTITKHFLFDLKLFCAIFARLHTCVRQNLLNLLRQKR